MTCLAPANTSLSPLNYPLQGAALIEASAGTGKTYTLALLYIRLVLQQGGDLAFHQPLLPPQILVVTFTRAATKELRDRIRQRLVETAQFLRQPSIAPNAEPLLVDLRQALEKEGASLTSSAYKLEIAAQAMDEAAISTIHGWCYRMLKEQAFNSGNLFQQELIENEDELLLTASQDYWRNFYLTLPTEALAQVLSFFKTPEATLDRVKNLLATQHLLEVPTASPKEIIATTNQQHQQELAAIKAQWQENELLPQLIETFALASKNKAYKGVQLNTKHIASVTDKLAAWLENPAASSTGIDYDKSSSYQRLALLDTSIWNDQAAIPYGNPASRALAALPAQLANLPKSFAQLLSHAVHWIAQRLTELKKQHSQLSNDDLLNRLDAALQSEQGVHLAKAIRQKFPVALVDEFQDTDPVQYRIFSRIYTSPEAKQSTAFFMIGDPKQAIYAFRGADIYTYLAAKQATSGKHFTLKENYRSAPALIAAVNSLFALGNQQEKGAFLFKTPHQTTYQDPVPFIEVTPGKTANQWLEVKGKPQSPMQAWVVAKDAQGKLTKEEFTQQTCQATASQIAKLLTAAQNQQAWLVKQTPNQAGEQLDKRLLQPADIAVLVNNKDEAASLREALNLRGVASVYLSESNSVFASKAANLLLNFLLAINNPYNATLVRQALAQPQLGLSLHQLDELNTKELVAETYLEDFLHYKQVWQQQGSLAVVHLLIKNFNLASQLLAQQGGERQLTDLLHLAELLQSAEAELDGEQALLRYLQEEQANPSVNSDLQELRLESDSQLVQLVTVHKSKGLEYPLVFLPFATHCRPAKATDVPLKTHNASGELQVHLTSNETALAQAEEERLAEDLRKLYVALTRASYCQRLGIGETDTAHKSALGYLLQADATANWQKVLAEKNLQGLEITLPEITEEVFIPQSSAATKPLLTPKLGQLTHWWIASYSAIEFTSTSSAFVASAQLSLSATPDKDTANPKEEQTQEETKLAASSTEAAANNEDEAKPEELSATNLLHYFPAGAVWGTHLHSLLEWAAVQEFTTNQGEHLQGFAALVAENTASKHKLLHFCQRRQLEVYAPHLWDWLVNFVQQEWQLPQLNAQFALASLQPSQFKVELEFMLESHKVSTLELDAVICQHTLNQASRPQAEANQLNGLLKGFIDLIVEHQGRYYVVDWKSNRLGKTAADYTPLAMQEQILAHRYDMQYVLYLVALHRLLKARLPNYSYDKHIGGAIYVFLRGMHGKQQAGLFCDKPPAELIEQLSDLLAGKKDKKDA